MRSSLFFCVSQRLLLLVSMVSTGLADDENAAESRIAARVNENVRLVRIEATAPRRPLTMGRRPLLKWSNPTRGQQQIGVVHVWEHDGRPEVIGCSFTYVYSDLQRFKMQLHSLSDSPLTAMYHGQTVWKPAAGGITWHAFNKAPSPSREKRLRLTQMRQLARRFRVTITTKEEDKLPLRLLPQPLHRYGSTTHGTSDGAIFSYVTATDPDALLLIETHAVEGQEQYRYAFARFHYWAIEATNAQGEIVWTVDADMTQMLHRMGEDVEQFPKPYVSFHVESFPVSDVPEPTATE